MGLASRHAIHLNFHHHSVHYQVDLFIENDFPSSFTELIKSGKWKINSTFSLRQLELLKFTVFPYDVTHNECRWCGFNCGFIHFDLPSYFAIFSIQTLRYVTIEHYIAVLFIIHIFLKIFYLCRTCVSGIRHAIGWIKLLVGQTSTTVFCIVNR